MDTQAVNKTLRAVIEHFEADEHEDMQEAAIFDGDGDDVALTESLLAEQYVGVGGSVPPDHSPMGDPLHGSPGGVDNMDPAAEMFMSYVSDVVNDVSAQCGVSQDDAMSALTAVADALAQEGAIPPMPDAGTSSNEDLSTWTGAAKTCDLGRRTLEYVKSEHGESPLHAVSSDATA